MAVIHDLLRLLSVFTFKRVWNYWLIKWSYFLSRITKRLVHKGKPAFISVEPTTNCNLKCPQCFTSDKKFTRPKGNLKPETFDEIIKQTSPHAFYMNLYFQGEPFLNENLSKFIRKAKQSRLYVAVSTNAHHLSAENINQIIEAGLDKIIVSLDGTDAETYKKYREGGDFNKVIEGIRLLVSVKKENKVNHPFIELQFLIHRKNETQAKQIKTFGKALGVNKVVIKSFQLLQFDTASEWLPKKNSRYNIDSKGAAIINSRFPNHCFRMWNSCVITWDGNIVPCCFDKNADHSMGNILNKNFIEIWESTQYSDFRKKVFTERRNINICSNCSEGII
jgi:radical SAM protein with 4Fe4S-binding SPASM domain